MKSRHLFVPMLAGLLICLAPALAEDRVGPFQHAPRSVRTRDVDQQHLRLELKFDIEQQTVHGRAIHTLTPFRPVDAITLDAAEMKIDKITIRAAGDEQSPRELKFTTARDELNITLDKTCAAGESLELTIDYVVTKPRLGVHFVVPDQDEPGQQKMLWTQCEPEFARYWFPCIDSPSDRLTSEILATVPAEYLVLSNGVLAEQTKNDDGTQTWHWKQQQSHVPYLLSVVAGEFDVLRLEWDGIPVESYVPHGRLDEAARSFDKTPRMVEFYSKKIGRRYPWPKYAQICVDEYEWGGMEHTSATTLNLETLHDPRAHLDETSDSLVAHELAHQWFGDLLTCKDWGELWLNESFATYFATLWTEHDLGADEAGWDRWNEAESYRKEDQRYRRPIVTYRYDDPDNMFDNHSYPKGGRVLHMLRFELGDELFWKAIAHYVARNEFRTVETADLRVAIEEATGNGMNWFFDQWLYHGGHPEFEVAWSWDGQAKMVRLNVKQTQRVDDMTPLFRTDVEIELAGPGATVSRRVTISQAEETFHFQLDQRPTRVCFDPQDWILKTLKFDKTKDELLDQLSNDSHVICRVCAAQGLTEFLKDQDVASALINAAQHDAFWAVRQEACKALEKFDGDELRAALISVAHNDEKSLVRREAIKTLEHFKHDDTRAALREIIKDDQSYFAVAAALRTLVKVDRENCSAELLAALDAPDHDAEILKAATSGLVELKSAEAESRLRAMLERPLAPERRVAVIAALARLKPEDKETAELLQKQLDSERADVRKAAIDAFIELGGTQAIDALQARRSKELNSRLVRRIDEALEKINGQQRDAEELRKQIESLRKENRSLEERLKKLEAAAAN